jgi:hypothetical protein
MLHQELKRKNDKTITYYINSSMITCSWYSWEKNHCQILWNEFHFGTLMCRTPDKICVQREFFVNNYVGFCKYFLSRVNFSSKWANMIESKRVKYILINNNPSVIPMQFYSLIPRAYFIIKAYPFRICALHQLTHIAS